MRQRSERFGNTTREVWTFRVERYDERGDRLPPVNVEMRGLQFRGVINEGDRVTVTGTWRDGTLTAERVHNDTTNSSVMAKSYKKAMAIALAVLAAFVALMVTAGLVISNRETDRIEDRRARAEEQFERDRAELERQAQENQERFCEEARRNGISLPNCD